MKKPLILSLIVYTAITFLPSSATAQWVATSGPRDGQSTNVRDLAVIDNNLFIATYASYGVYHYNASEKCWNAVNNGLPRQLIQGRGFGECGKMLFICPGLAGQLFRSKDYGTTWTETDSGLSGMSIYSIIGNDTIQFIGSNYGCFRSIDSGASWTNVLPISQIPVVFILGGPVVFTGVTVTNSGIYRSLDNGTNWIRVDSVLKKITAFASIGTVLFASQCGSGVINGVYKSIDSGVTWVETTSGISDTISYKNFQCLIANKGTLFAGTGLGSWGGSIYRSLDSGVSWTQVNFGLPNAEVWDFAAIGDTIYACGDSGVFQSIDNGNNWSAINNGLTVNTINSLLAIQGSVLAGTSTAHIFRSRNNGANWALVASANVNSFSANATNIFAGTGSGVLLSADTGTIWSWGNNGLTNTSVLSILASNGYIFAGVTGHLITSTVYQMTLNAASIDGVYRSNDNGLNWIQVSNGFPPYFYTGGSCIPLPCIYGYRFVSVSSLAAIGTYILAGTDHVNSPVSNDGFFRSADNGGTWTQISTLANIKCLIVSNGNIFAGTFNRGIYRSTDSGISWTSVNSGLTDTNILSLAANATILYAGTRGGGVFRSSDSGTSWSEFNTGLTQKSVYSLTVKDSELFAGTGEFGGRVWRRLLSSTPTAIKQQAYLPERISFNILSRNRSVSVAFSLPHSSPVQLKVYNLSGHLVATLLDRPMQPGAHTIAWDTRSLASGCYMVRLQAGATTKIKSIPLFR